MSKFAAIVFAVSAVAGVAGLGGSASAENNPTEAWQLPRSVAPATGYNRYYGNRGVQQYQGYQRPQQYGYGYQQPQWVNPKVARKQEQLRDRYVQKYGYPQQPYGYNYGYRQPQYYQPQPYYRPQSQYYYYD